MSKFDEKLFEKSGGYLFYSSKFVARFKYSSRDLSGFKSFLKKNFTVEEYFNLIQEGYAPVTILESKGYISATVKRLLKSIGYAPTVEGKKAYLEQQIERSKERFAESYYANQVSQAISSL
jgi:predicted PP-loop superfamily ATPase